MDVILIQTVLVVKHYLKGVIASPSAKPKPFTFANIDELREDLTFIIDDIYSLLDYALARDGKGVMSTLHYGGMGQDISAWSGIPFVTNGASGQLALGTGLVFDPVTGKLHLNVTAKGDILGATGDEAMALLAVGAAGQILSVGGGHATGLNWIEPDPKAYRGTLADAASVSILFVRPCWGTLLIGNDAARSLFTLKMDGTVNLIVNKTATIVANANTAGKFCLGTGVANPIVLKNNTGAPQDYAFTVW